MKLRRFIAAISKSLVLLLMLVGIFYYLRIRQPQDVIDDAADDLLEQVGDTYVSVHVTKIMQKTMHRFITAYGRVEAAPGNMNGPAASASISVPSAARVISVNCSEGQSVESGQALFTLDNLPLQRMVAADESAVNSARSTRDSLFSDQATPQWVRAQVDRQLAQDQVTLARDKAQLAALTFTSPIAGIITRVTITAGSIADPLRAAVEIVDLHRLVIALDVSADALKEITIGNEAFGSFGQSKVNRIDAAVDPQSGLGSVDIALPADTSLRPGQSATAQIAVQTQPNCLVVPTSSIVMDENNHPTVAIVDESGRLAVRTVVRTGIVENGDVAITGDAIHAGESVVTVGAYGLTERTRVNLLRD